MTSQPEVKAQPVAQMQNRELFERIDRLVRFAYFVGGGLVLLGMWVAGQQLTDQYQWDAINRHGEEMAAREKRIATMEQRFAVIEERTKTQAETLARMDLKLEKIADAVTEKR